MNTELEWDKNICLGPIQSISKIKDIKAAWPLGLLPKMVTSAQKARTDMISEVSIKILYRDFYSMEWELSSTVNY